MMSQCSVMNFGYKSAWYTFEEKEKLLSQLHPGDLIEFRRGVYHHWAVYAGGWFATEEDDELKVFHAGSAGHFNSGNVFFGCMSLQKGRHGMGAVSVDPLYHVWMNSEARLNNEMDEEYPPYDPSEILIRGEIRIKNQKEYNLITNNCEHFAVWCRNGVRKSIQSTVTVTTGLTIVSTYACMALAGAIVMLLRFRSDVEDEFIVSDGAEDEDEVEKDETRGKKKLRRRIMSIPLD